MITAKGRLLALYIDHSDSQNIRYWLRQPKRTHPSLTHALHNLWVAYTKLEADHEAALEKLRIIREEATSR